MKHTYLYPLEDDEQWLWRAARMDGVDLFGNPPPDAPDVEWLLSNGIGEAVGAAREELHKRLESRDRICIGRHYMIPGSLCEGAQARAKDADRTVREVTRELWDAPYLHGYTYAFVWSVLEKAAGRDGRDEWAEISAFLKTHRVTKDNGRRIRVIPVWM